MNKSKKVFMAIAVVFFGLLFYASYDIATRTTFPGSTPQLQERINQTYFNKDSLTTDSLKR